MSVLEYRVNWGSGGPNPGVTVLHGRIAGASTAGLAADDLANRARTFFDAIKSLVAGAVTFSFPAEVTELNTTTGVLEDVHNITAPAAVVSTGTGNYLTPAGMRVEWRTGAIVAGRRLRGRTFLVPITTACMDSTGTIATASIATAQTAANAYWNTSVFTDVQPSVWSRRHGVQADILSAVIPDEAAVLRSRRD